MNDFNYVIPCLFIASGHHTLGATPIYNIPINGSSVMIVGVIVGAAVATGIFCLIGLYGANARGPHSSARRVKQRCVSTPLLFVALLLLLFVGYGLYHWTDAKARLQETPWSVPLFVAYVVLAIEATLCLVTLYALDV